MVVYVLLLQKVVKADVATTWTLQGRVNVMHIAPGLGTAARTMSRCVEITLVSVKLKTIILRPMERFEM